MQGTDRRYEVPSVTAHEYRDAELSAKLNVEGGLDSQARIEELCDATQSFEEDSWGTVAALLRAHADKANALAERIRPLPAAAPVVRTCSVTLVDNKVPSIIFTRRVLLNGGADTHEFTLEGHRFTLRVGE